MKSAPAEIRTARLLLRRWRDMDRDRFAALNADPEVMRYFLGTRDREESDREAAFLHGRFEADGFGPWAVELPGRADFIGFVGPWRMTRVMPFSPAVEIGWRLSKEHWGKGYAVEAANAALADLFARTTVDEVVAYTAVSNTPSQRVMEKLGMTCNRLEDFDHPAAPEGHPLRRGVLYRLRRDQFGVNA